MSKINKKYTRRQRAQRASKYSKSNHGGISMTSFNMPSVYHEIRDDEPCENVFKRAAEHYKDNPLRKNFSPYFVWEYCDELDNKLPISKELYSKLRSKSGDCALDKFYCRFQAKILKDDYSDNSFVYDIVSFMNDVFAGNTEKLAIDEIYYKQFDDKFAIATTMMFFLNVWNQILASIPECAHMKFCATALEDVKLLTDKYFNISEMEELEKLGVFQMFDANVMLQAIIKVMTTPKTYRNQILNENGTYYDVSYNFNERLFCRSFEDLHNLNQKKIIYAKTHMANVMFMF